MFVSFGRKRADGKLSAILYIYKKNAHMDRNEITGIKSRAIKFKLGWNICHDLLRVAYINFHDVIKD